MSFGPIPASKRTPKHVLNAELYSLPRISHPQRQTPLRYLLLDPRSLAVAR